MMRQVALRRIFGRIALCVAMVFGLALSACSASGNTEAEAKAAGPPLAAADIALIDRLTWGVNASEIARFKAMGRQRWIDWQLRADAPLAMPAPLQAKFDAMPIARAPMGELVVGTEKNRLVGIASKDPVIRKALYGEAQQAQRGYQEQTFSRSILRDLYSPDQLREQMTWFWFNHFNVRIAQQPLGALVRDYEELTIRPLALGHFCDLVDATLRHPAMLVYLGNTASKAGKINENYARELMELHTMGVGSGYTQADVQSLARILTGARVDFSTWPAPPAPDGGFRNGVFLFDPALHDNGPKTLLGHRFKAKGYGEISEATNLLCHQPATARRISEKIARYLVADVPPPALVDRMTATFIATDGDITAVLRTMIGSPEFDASLGTLFKDPQHYLLSMIRLAFDDRIIAQPLVASSMLAVLGQPLFGRLTPDGYPLDAAEWSGSGQLADRFTLAAAIGGGGARRLFAASNTRESLMTTDLKQADLKAVLAETGIHATLKPETRAALAASRNAAEWNALFLSSPEFMRR